MGGGSACLVNSEYCCALLQVSHHQAAYLAQEWLVVGVFGVEQMLHRVFADGLADVFVLDEVEVGQQTDELLTTLVDVEVLLQVGACGNEQVVVEVVVLALLPQYAYLLNGLVLLVLRLCGRWLAFWLCGQWLCGVGIGDGCRCLHLSRPTFEHDEHLIERHHCLTLIALHALVEQVFGCRAVVVARSHVDAGTVDGEGLRVGEARHGIVSHHALCHEQELHPGLLGVLAVAYCHEEVVGRNGLVILAQSVVERVAQLVAQKIFLAVVEDALKRTYLVDGIAGNVEP